jgi:hypothetical protein
MPLIGRRGPGAPPPFEQLLDKRVAEHNGLDADELRAETDRLSYRRGFLLTRGAPGHDVAELRDWHQRRLGRHRLLTHPDTLVATRRARGTHVALLGIAFDPESPHLTPDEVLDAVLRALPDESAFHALLDRLAGRFRLLVATSGTVRVWHDAMGSASVFYREGGGSCASHADLLARVHRLPLRDVVIPYITTPNYRRRDVKYLPGLISPYEEVLQLTPNTRLDVGSGSVTRYWPREPLRPTTPAEAGAALEQHLRGIAAWFVANGRSPVLGLTGGSDSRGLLVACADLEPTLFTYARSEDGTDLSTPDVATATALAQIVGRPLHTLGVPTKVSLNDVSSPLDAAYRRGAGGVRGIGAAWLGPAAEQLPLEEDPVFVRGFGGEVLRGFYQTHRTASSHVSANQLARTYDVNAGSAPTRAAFEHFIHTTDAKAPVELGYDPNDVLYWEHRMGVWGSAAMSENDLVFTSTIGYSSRNLYEAFLGLDFETRHSRTVVHETYRRMHPELGEHPYA